MGGVYSAESPSRAAEFDERDWGQVSMLIMAWNGPGATDHDSIRVYDAVFSVSLSQANQRDGRLSLTFGSDAWTQRHLRVLGCF